MMNKEEYIEKVMNSAKEIKSMEPSDSLYARIQYRIENTTANVFSFRQIISIAAAILLLIAVNIALVVNSNKSTKSQEANALVEQFDSSSSDNIYNL